MPPAPERIHALESLASDPGLCRVRIGRRLLGPVRRDDAERLGIREGATWTKARATAFAALLERTEIRRRALLALARSPIASEALRERLLRRGFAERSVREALTQLAADGWLDDARSARERVASMTRRGAVAHTAMDMLLEGEGYAGPARRQAIRAQGEGDLDAASAEASKGADRGMSTRSIALRLARRGFEVDIIRDALLRCGRRFDDDE